MISRRCFLVQILLMLPSLMWTMSAKCCFLWNDMCSRGLDLQGFWWLTPLLPMPHVMCVACRIPYGDCNWRLGSPGGWLLLLCRWDDITMVTSRCKMFPFLCCYLVTSWWPKGYEMSVNHNITVDDRSCVAPEEGTDAAATDAAAAVTTGVVAITSTKQ